MQRKSKLPPAVCVTRVPHQTLMPGSSQFPICNDLALQTPEGCLQAHNCSHTLLLHGGGRQSNTHRFPLHRSCPHSPTPTVDKDSLRSNLDDATFCLFLAYLLSSPGIRISYVTPALSWLSGCYELVKKLSPRMGRWICP